MFVEVFFFQFDLKLTLEVLETVIQFLVTFKVSQDQNLHHTLAEFT